ncbi:MAG: VIT1/CCC1 transporter family protein [Ilumatobacteraceae bacterium]
MSSAKPFQPRTTPNHSHRSVAGGLARVAVFGVSDGLVSNVSLILGFAGANVGPSVVRLAGLAGGIAGAASMAAGEWVSISAQNELIEREVALERAALADEPAAETEELVAIYRSHGMSKERARAAALEVMSEPEAALMVHAREELGIDPGELASAWRAAGLSLVCFIVGAILPVIPWFVASGRAATVASIVIGILAAAVVGTMIGRLAERPWIRTATRQVFIMLLACGATYLVGRIVGVSIN